MKTNELNQQEQEQTNGGSMGTMPGATSDVSPTYQPESVGAVYGDGQTAQQAPVDQGTDGYEGPGDDGVSPSHHYIK